MFTYPYILLGHRYFKFCKLMNQIVLDGDDVIFVALVKITSL